jgi:hypothetical protein
MRRVAVEATIMDPAISAITPTGFIVGRATIEAPFEPSRSEGDAVVSPPDGEDVVLGARLPATGLVARGGGRDAGSAVPSSNVALSVSWS